MTPERWRRIEDVFERVSELEGESREQALRECCPDPALEGEVRRLLSNLESAGPFLEVPPPAVTALWQEDTPLYREGDHLIGRFEIMRLLGRGGMGEVYEAQDHAVGERVALKTLSPRLLSEDGAARRLRDELRRARRVTHPNVCRLHELFETQDPAGRPAVFLTMELLEGETLGARLQRIGAPDRRWALAVLTQVAWGLEAAHQAGILHRDLKPGNIFLRRAEIDPQVVLTDFGLACGIGPESPTSPHGALPAGTPGYMAPEQYREGPLTPAVDIYAMGVIAREMIYGTQRRPAAAIPRGSLERWDRAIARATAAEPAARFRTPSEFAAACSSPAGWSRRGAVGAAALAAACGAVLAIPGKRRGKVKLAVLPFEAPQESDEHWAGGLTEALIRCLRSETSLEVIGGDSVNRKQSKPGSPFEAGRELQVDWVVGGTVTRNREGLRIHAELLRPEGSAVFWSRSLTGAAGDFGAMSLDLARQIGNQLEVSQAQWGPAFAALPANPVALDHYLRGRSFWNRRFRDQLLKAREEFQKSLEADPRFALGYCGLADVLSTLADYHAEPPASILPAAKQAALTALSLDSRLADSHVSFGQATALHDSDWSSADVSFRRAIALDGRHPLARQWYSLLLMKLGLADECLAQARELVRLDPFSVSAHRNLCLMLYFTRHYREALEVGRKVMAMSPDYFGIHELAGECHARLGERENAMRECAEALRKQQTPGIASTWAAVSYAILGLRGEAENLIAALIRDPSAIRFQPTNVARAWAELGEMDHAFEWLERAFLERDTMLQVLPVHASFDELRLDRRYPPFLARLRISYPRG